MKPATKWILAIITLLGGNLLAMVVLVTMASTSQAQIIDDYYARATHFDDVLDDATRSHALGWSVDVVVVAGELRVVARDRQGTAIPGARVHVTGYPRAEAKARIDLVLTTGASGTAAIPGAFRRGWYDLTVIAERGPDRFTRYLAVDAP